MNRRKFIHDAGLVGIATLIIPNSLACNSPTEPKNERPDLDFSNTRSEADAANVVSSSAILLKTSALEKKAVTVGVGSSVITLLPVNQKIQIKVDQVKEIFIRFGTIRTSPSIIMESTDGTIIYEKSITPSLGDSWSPEEWLAKAVLVLAGALAVWLGATVIKLVASAIAFLAVNLLILSVIISAAAILAWLIERTGWSFDGLLELIKNGSDWIKDLLKAIIAQLP